MSLVALPTLIFPTYGARIDNSGPTLKIFDDVRKKYVALTPEEWVRQHCVHWLVSRGYPIGRASVERTIDKGGMRYDLMFVTAELAPYLLVECKAPDVAVSVETLRQTSWYNLWLKAPFVLLTNGRSAYCASLNSDGTLDLLNDIPEYPGP